MEKDVNYMTPTTVIGRRVFDDSFFIRCGCSSDLIEIMLDHDKSRLMIDYFSCYRKKNKNDTFQTCSSNLNAISIWFELLFVGGNKHETLKIHGDDSKVLIFEYCDSNSPWVMVSVHEVKNKRKKVLWGIVIDEDWFKQVSEHISNMIELEKNYGKNRLEIDEKSSTN